MKHLYTFLCSLIAAGTALGQTYNMPSGTNTVSTCSGTFYDSGGSGGTYGILENRTYTICPSTPGSRVQVNFTAFNLENTYDFLYIYDGNSTAAPSMGAYTGTAGPGLVSATPTNPTGCLTFRFTSDISGNNSGWAGTISCTVPCQTITAVLNSASPAPAADGIIRICQGSSVTFNGGGTFSSSGAGATYSWNFGDNTTATGATVTKTFPNAGSFRVNLTVTDPNNCKSNNTIDQLVYVSTTPNITTTATPSTICLGQSAALAATVTPVQFTPNCTPPVSGTTFLPDGTGVSYTTSIPVNCFAVGQTITSAAQIQNICLNMEHSYLGDLSISIICPNGQTTSLLAYAAGDNTGGEYLGTPIDIDTDLSPGTGANYCFTAAAAATMNTAAGSIASGVSLPAGNYLPVGNYSSLIGCPANGNWTIQVTDNLSSDNGYIFNWDINFANTLVPFSGVFTPTVSTQGWVADPALTTTGTTTASVTPTATGNQCYTYSITDNFGCTYTQNRCVTVTPGVTAAIAPASASICTGQNVTLTASGGGTYLWSTGATSAAITVNPGSTTTYTVTVTNGGCTGTASRTVNVSTGVTATNTFSNVSCFGGSDGSINVAPANGTLPYSYNWGGGITTEDRTGLAAGTYTITITDALGCVATSTANITQPTAVSGATALTNVSCLGGNNGAINLTASGGTSPYTYNWGGGITTEDRTGLSVGTYTVTITDVRNCTATATATITGTSAISVSSSSTPVSCFGGNNGAIDISASGGTSPYSYNWGGGITSEDRINLTANTYTVTVTDGNSCTATASATITQPAAALTASNTFTNVSCFGGNNGSIDVTASGGTAPYSYNWGGGITNEDRTNLTAGTYTVTITDANSCTATSSATLTQPTALSATATGTDPGCNGGSNGTATVVASGGTAPYNYLWSNNNNIATATNLGAGTHTVTVTDANNCTTTANVTLGQPAALALSMTNTAVSCFNGDNGTATVSAAGGTGVYSYLWSAAANNQTTATATGLSAATHTVTVTDANNCTASTTVVLTEPSAVSLSLSAVGVLCNGSATGEATANPSGGVGGYSFVWGSAANGQTTATVTGLVPGIIGVTVTDANGCAASGSATISNVPVLALTTSGTAVSCFGGNNGSVTVTAFGGVGSYAYLWDAATGNQTTATATNVSAGAHCVTVTDANGCTASACRTISQPPTAVSASNTFVDVSCFGGNNGSINVSVSGGAGGYSYDWGGGITSQDRTGLVAGIYTVTVTDANGCTTTTSATINQPATALSVSSSSTPVSCFGGNNGAIDISASGGTSPYSYNWGGGITSEDRINLTANTYTVTVTDGNSCTATASATITQPAAALTASNTFTNVSCFGGNNGSIDVTASGGTAPYSYNWGGGITNEDRTNLTAGTYTVTITDANSCTVTTGATINEPATALSATNTFVPVSCFGGNNGSIDVTATGGTAPYSYNWGGGITNEDRTNLTAGTYTVTITDANNCTTTTSATINQPATGLSATNTFVNISCNGGSNGSIDVTASGGTAPYSYNWGGGITSEDRTGLAAGTYTVTISDANNCTATTGATLTAPVVLTASNTFTNVSCFGGNNGSIDVTASGGTAPYSYNWGGGITNEDRTNLTAGTYTVTITDANSCTVTTGATINEPATALSATNTFVPVSCFGGNNGSIDVTATGGTAPYSYNWGGGITNEDRTNLTAGTYTVTITDANNCTTTTSATINQPATGLSATNTFVNISCNGGSNGSIDVTASGGTAPYSYNWGGGITSEDRTGLAAGTYTVTISDANNCTATTGATLTAPVVLTASNTFTNVSCFGGNNGSIDVTASGGTAPYSYNWGGGITNEDRTNLTAGTYTVTITDANSCTVTTGATINEPATALSATNTFVPVSCFGGNNGSIDVTATGGTAPYTYNWGGGITNEDRTGLVAGTYTVTITDANNCTTTTGATINQPATGLSATNTFVNISCNGGSNGSIDVTATGGTAPYSYDWGGGITSEDRTGLAAGTYTVTISDANNCTATTGATLTAPVVLTASNTFTNVSCFGGNNGSIDVTASGGTAPYSYNWGGGITNEDRTNLTAGTYTVTITDANSCTVTTGATINEPATALSATNTFVPVSCFGGNNGSIDVTATGGTAPYTYNWGGGITNEDRINLTAGTYTVTITDANNCTTTTSATINQPATGLSATNTFVNISCNGGSNGSIDVTASGGTAPYSYDWGGGITSEDRTGLAAGTYTVTISDANNCTATTGATLTAPVVLTASNTFTNVSCFGGNNGSIDVTASGGTAPYSYNWGGGITNEDRTNLTAGTYTVTITDANSCTVTTGATINEPATALSATNTFVPVSCFGGNNGSIDVTATGGTAPYSYNWGGGITNEDRTGLVAGTYTVTITDANNCTTTTSATINQPATGLSATNTFVNISCNGGSNGSIDVTASGGTAPYSYNWGGGITSEDRTGLAAGTYTVTISDANNCTASSSVTISEPGAVSVSVNGTNISCNGGSNGTATATGSGGTVSGAYDFVWDNGQTTATNTGLSAGQHCVTMTDDNGCTTSACITLTEPSAVTASAVSSAVSCFNGADGTATVTGSGGTGGYNYQWSASAGGQTTATATGLHAGTYGVTVVDANGCSGSTTIAVTQPATAVSVSLSAVAVLCNGSATGTATATASGGVGGYSYAWGSAANGQTTATATGLTAGIIGVTVTDANGCSATGTVAVPNVPALAATTSGTSVSCFGGSDGSVTVNAFGGVGGFSYQWSASAGGQTTATAVNVPAGQHCVTVTDANGCTLSACRTINQPTALAVPNIVVTNVLCFGETSGSATASTSGGVQPYSYAWSDGQTTATATGLSGGMTYTVTISDANGCSVSGSGTIQSPTALVVAMSSDPVACKGQATGTAIAAPSGGTPGYAYLWNDGAISATNSGQLAGSYTVTVTDANGCTVSGNVVVSEPLTAVSVNILSFNNISCHSGNDGAIQADAFGGTPGYSFVWNSGETTAAITGLSVGTYRVTVTDAAGCTVSTSRTLTQPSAIVLQTQVYSNYNGSDISCPGAGDGMARVVASGGAGSYTYAWSGGNATTTSTISGLLAGSYTVTVTDASGCTAVGNITLEDPTPLAASEVHVNVFCHGQSTGQIIVTATAGTGTIGVNGYEYSISGPGANQPFGSNNVFTGLVAGTYTVIVRDGNDCELPMSIEITEPQPLSSTVSSTSANCAGSATGSLTATPTGGTSPYNYRWTNGQTGATATGLLAGNYSVTVTDAGGCVYVTNGTVTEPTALAAAVSSQGVSCNGGSNGSASVTISGGTAPYTQLWSNGQNGLTASGLGTGNHAITVTDANGCTVVKTFTISQPAVLNMSVTGADALCNGSATGSATATVTGGSAPYTILWNDGQTGAVATGLAAGNYSVIATDANGCLANGTVSIDEPTAMVLNFPTSSQPDCNGGNDGSATVSASGGTSPYSYAWTNGQTTATATGLTAGAHTVTVTDGNGCQVSATLTLGEPAALAVTLVNQVDVSCKDGSDGRLNVLATGGTAPYSYQWSNSQTGASATGLTAGIYTVTATDTKGCKSTMSLQISEPASALVGSITTTPALCRGEASGQVATIVSGGTNPYSYAWSNGSTASQLLNVGAGNYFVTITDGNGCRLLLNGVVTQPTAVNAQIISSIDPTCSEGTDGAATVAATGGTGAITFQWSDAGGQTSAIATGLSAGMYYVTATDANGCTDSDSIEIEDPAPISAVSVVTDVSCYGGNDGVIRINSVSVPVGMYAWSTGATGATTNSVSGLQSGDYRLTITSNEGCTTVLNFTVEQPDTMTAAISVTQAILCAGDATGELLAVAAGGNGSYSYDWNTGNSTAALDSAAAGTYTVTVTDVQGCTATASLALGEPNPLVISAEATGILCTGDANGSIAVTGSGGTLVVNPYQYSIDTTQAVWQTGNLFSNLGAGIYEVYVMDDNGCVDTTQVSVEDADPFFINLFTVMDTTVIEYFDTITLEAGLNDTTGAVWVWTTGLDTLNDSTFVLVQAPSETISYTFTATNSNGCVVDTTVVITVNKPRRIGVAGAFSPNGDGRNDYLFVQGDDKVAQVNMFRVYSRWGELVYEGQNLKINEPTAGWDGTFRTKPMNSAVFAWYAEVQFLDGHVELIRGDATLLR